MFSCSFAPAESAIFWKIGTFQRSYRRTGTRPWLTIEQVEGAETCKFIASKLITHCKSRSGATFSMQRPARARRILPCRAPGWRWMNINVQSRRGKCGPLTAMGNGVFASTRSRCFSLNACSDMLPKLRMARIFLQMSSSANHYGSVGVDPRRARRGVENCGLRDCSA